MAVFKNNENNATELFYPSQNTQNNQSPDYSEEEVIWREHYDQK